MGIQKAEEAIKNSIGCKLHNNNKFIMYFIVAEGLSLSWWLKNNFSWISFKKFGKWTLENIEGQSKLDNQEKLGTLGTQDEEKQNKNRHNMSLTPLHANKHK